MNSSFDNLKHRTQTFAVNTILAAQGLANNEASKIISKQLIRAGTSVGANYRTACRARSHADFISKITIVEEEADECSYWIEILELANLASSDKLKALKKESEELTAIFTASAKTAKKNRSIKTKKEIPV